MSVFGQGAPDHHDMQTCLSVQHLATAVVERKQETTPRGHRALKAIRRKRVKTNLLTATTNNDVRLQCTLTERVSPLGVGQLVFFLEGYGGEVEPEEEGEGEKSVVLQRKGSLFFFVGLVMWLLRGQTGNKADQDGLRDKGRKWRLGKKKQSGARSEGCNESDPGDVMR